MRDAMAPQQAPHKRPRVVKPNEIPSTISATSHQQATCSPAVKRYKLLPVCCCLLLAIHVMPHWPYWVSTTSIKRATSDSKGASASMVSVQQEASSSLQGAPRPLEQIQATLVSASGALAFHRQPLETHSTDPCLAEPPSLTRASLTMLSSASTTELVTVEGTTLRLNIVVILTGFNGRAGHEPTASSRQQVVFGSRLRVEWSRMGRPLVDASRLSQMIIDEADSLIGKQLYGSRFLNESGKGAAASLEETSELPEHPQRSPFMLAPYANQQHLDRLAAIASSQLLHTGGISKLQSDKGQLVDDFIGESRSINWQRLESYLSHNSAELRLWGLAANKCGPANDGPLNEINRLMVVQVELARVTRHDRGAYQVHLCSSTSGNQQNCFDLSLQLHVLDDVPSLVGLGPEPQLLEPGEQLTLRCQATGFTLPQITWYLDGQQLSDSSGAGGLGAADDNGQMHADEGGSDRLRIGDYVSQDAVVHSFVNASRVQVSDGGTYKCQASNGLHTVERSARVDVHGLPLIVRHLQNLSELAGQPQLAIHCPYSGWPVSAIEWLHLPEDMDQLSAESFIHRIKRTHNKIASGAAPENQLAWLTDPDQAPDPSDPSDWLAQASAITPGSLDDYPEPVPDDYPQSFADYADLEMDFQQLTVDSGRVGQRQKRQASQEPVWIKMPQSRRHQLHPNGTLLIHDVTRADQGLYKCRVVGLAAQPASQTQAEDVVANQPPEAISNAFQLTILVAPVISPFASSDSLREGMRNFLTCSVIEGDSPIRLQWFKDGHPIVPLEEPAVASLTDPAGTPDWTPPYSQPRAGGLSQASRIRAETNNEYTSTLYFSHVEFKDNGNYTCMASNKAASVNYTTRMLVNVAPKWSKPPKDLQCVTGQSIVIDCQAEAYPSARVWWEIGVYAQQQPEAKGLASSQLIGIQQQLGARHLPSHYRTIISNSHIHILENASLVIRDVQRQDQGFYLCQAANNFGSLSALIRLTVNVGASFASKYLLKYARLNERLELDCDPNGQTQVEAIWFMRRSNNQQLGNLSSGANLHANQQPHQFHQPLEQQLKGIDQQHQPAASSVAGIRLFNVTLKTSEPAARGSASPVVSSSGVRFREQSLEPSISLEIHQQRQLSDANQTAGFSSGGGAGELAKLIISRATRLHSADFICRASNRFGSDEKLFRVLVQEPPDPVEELSVVQVGARQVNLAWRQPYSGNLPITGYTLEWAPSDKGGEPSWTQTRAPLHHQTTFTLASLQPHSSYLIRARAHNQLGQSAPPRTPLLVVTAEEAPSTPPADLRASPLSSTALQLSWEEPADSATIKGFYIGYRLADSSDPFVFKAVSIMDTMQVVAAAPNGSANHAGQPQSQRRRLGVQISDLRRNSRYSTILQAFNSAGPGPQSDPVEARTLFNDPPGPPQLRANTAGYTSIELHFWFLQPTNVDGYQLYFRQAQAIETTGWQERKLLAQHLLEPTSANPKTAIQSLAHSTSDTSALEVASTNRTTTSPVRYILDGLLCGRAYQIYLVAYNSVGTGQASQVVRAKTRGSTPVAPRAADYVVANLSSARLNLDAWSDGGCSLLGFTIRSRRLHKGRGAGLDEEPATRSDWQQVINLQSADVRPVMLENLEPESWYLIETVAESEAGKSQATHSFMTLNKFGQLPNEALLETGGVVNGIPALFRVGTRSILHTLSPILITGCLCLLLIFAACSLLVARKYNNHNQSSDQDEGFPRSEPGNPSFFCSQQQNFQQTQPSNNYDHYSVSKGSPSKTATTVLTGSSENSGLMLSGSSLCNDASYMSPNPGDSLDLSQFMRQQPPVMASDVLNICNNTTPVNLNTTDYCTGLVNFHPQQQQQQQDFENQFRGSLRLACNGGSNFVAPGETNYMASQEDATRFKTLPHKHRVFQPTTCDKMKMLNHQLCSQIQSNHCDDQDESQKHQMYSKLRMTTCNSHSSYNICQNQYSPASVPTTVPSNPFPNPGKLSDVQARQIYNTTNEEALNLALLTQQTKRTTSNGGEGFCSEAEAANKLSSILLDHHQQMMNGDQSLVLYSGPHTQPANLKMIENDSNCEISLGANSNSVPSAANSSIDGGISSAGTSGESQHQDSFLNLGCGRGDKLKNGLAYAQQCHQSTGNQAQLGCNGEQLNGEYAMPFLPKWV